MGYIWPNDVLSTAEVTEIIRFMNEVEECVGEIGEYTPSIQM
jgi:uncharacterized protein YktA (UPF0223 family)